MKRAPDEPAATLRQRNKTPSSSSSARKDIASSQQAVEKKDSDSNFAIPPIDSVSPWLVALLYFLNPLSIMSCVSNSTTVWSFAALTGSLHHACRGNSIQSMFLLAAATYLGVYPVVAVAPCMMILLSSPGKVEGKGKEKGKSGILAMGFLFLLFFAILMAASYILMDNSMTFIESTYGVMYGPIFSANDMHARLFVPDLSPNIGLHWYFFIEMFDQFRLFFQCVFQLVACFALVAPVCTKFARYPVFAAYVLIALSTILKTYPSIGDLALSFALVPLFPELFRYTSGLYLPSMFLISSSWLLPMFHHLWLYSGSGNANFFYASTLVLNTGHVGWVIELIRAKVKREGERKGGVLRQLNLETAIM
ncbi:MAG: hypothetical protein SGCHY_003052 [Lobulomycetales sp.]